MTSNTSTTVEFLRIRENAIVPNYATAGAAGVDLHAVDEDYIAPGKWKLIKCGFAMALPPGFEAQVRPRSGLALKRGVTVLNSPGTIDSDYRGEMGVVLINHGIWDFHINPGDRIAQMVIARVQQVDFKVVTTLEHTARGTGGFGSTGVAA